MRVYVEVRCPDQALVQAVAERIALKWSARGVQIVKDDEGLDPDSARLFVGSGQSRILGGVIQERIDIASNRETDRDELLFRLDAKLGRLVHSDMAAQRKSLIRTGGPMSRRDFFSGLRHAYRMTSDFPVVLGEKCEARYGCAKCVNSCPVQAIAVSGHSVMVDEKKCTECGLCAAFCPAAAIQMPWFSQESLLGLLDGIDESNSPMKSLVLTCRRESVPSEPWIDVEEIHRVGAVGRQQLAVAAASSLGAVIVYCPDGMCGVSKEARNAAESVSATLERKHPDGTQAKKAVFYLEGEEMKEKVVEIHRAARSGRPMTAREGGWRGYAMALNALATKGIPASGLGFTEAVVNDSCTLCGACVASCPHGSFRISRGELSFNPATCTGCGACIGVCPEKSIDLRPAGENTTFPLAPQTVHRDTVVTCLECGRPVGSERFLNHVSKVAHLDMKELRHCPDCKRRTALEGTLREAGVSTERLHGTS